MKKFLTIITASIVITSFAYAQDPATPNAGFENWTLVGSRYDPVSWNNLNPSTSVLGVYTCTRASGVDKHSGTYAIKLQTKSVFFQTANGIASTGTIKTSAPYGISGGIPFTGRPDSISGWFKYTPVGADSGFVQFQLFAAGDTVGNVRFQTGNYTTGAYTRFSAPITYYSAATPDTALWLLSSSRAANPILNSALYIDDLELIYNPLVCNVPTGLNTTTTTATSFKTNWTSVAGALSYKVRYRVKGTTAWTTVGATTNSKTVTGLVANTIYQWQVRSKCTAIAPILYSAWSPTQTITTLVAKIGDQTISNATSSNQLILYPNPSKDNISLSFEAVNDGMATLTVVNTIGQVMLNKSIIVVDGVYNDNLDISSLSNGVYSVRIQTATETTIQKLIIQ